MTVLSQALLCLWCGYALALAIWATVKLRQEKKKTPAARPNPRWLEDGPVFAGAALLSFAFGLSRRLGLFDLVMTTGVGAILALVPSAMALDLAQRLCTSDAPDPGRSAARWARPLRLLGRALSSDAVLLAVLALLSWLAFTGRISRWFAYVPVVGFGGYLYLRERGYRGWSTIVILALGAAITFFAFFTEPRGWEYLVIYGAPLVPAWLRRLAK